MRLVVLGLNHKTVPVTIREQFAVSEESARSGRYPFYMQQNRDLCSSRRCRIKGRINEVFPGSVRK